MKRLAGGSVSRLTVMQSARALNLWAPYTIIEPRQTRGFHANEEPRWIRWTKIPASKLYVLIL